MTRADSWRGAQPVLRLVMHLVFLFHKTRPEDPHSTENQNLQGDPDLAGDSDIEIDPGLEGHPGFERALSDVDPFPKARENILNGNAGANSAASLLLCLSRAFRFCKTQT